VAVIVLIWAILPKEDGKGESRKQCLPLKGYWIRSIWVVQSIGIKKVRNMPALKKLSTNYMIQKAQI